MIYLLNCIAFPFEIKYCPQQKKSEFQDFEKGMALITEKKCCKKLKICNIIALIQLQVVTLFVQKKARWKKE